MLKALIAAVIIAALAFGGWELYLQWSEVKDKNQPKTEQAASTAPTVSDSASLPGMPPALEAGLDISRTKGAIGLKNFLTRYRKSIQDPRLAAIELDYVVLVAPKDPAEARKVFARVKERTPATSPVYPRVQQLEKTFE